MTKRKRMQIAGVILIVLIGIVAFALHWAAQRLRDEIVAGLGPQSSVGAVSVGLFAVEISDLRIEAPPGWPAADALRARRIEIAPDWRALLLRRVALRSIRVDGAYLSVWRAPDGRLRLLPSLLEKQRGKKDGTGAGAEAEAPAVSIAHIALADGSVDFFDSTVQRPAHRIRLEQVAASLDDLHLPALDGRSALKLSGLIKGARGDGRFDIDGEVALASKDSELIASLRGVDLLALKPYLIRAADTGVRHGTLDMDLRSTVKHHRLRAPGSITLHRLELDDGGNFLGLPRQAAVGALKNGQGDIRVSFVLEGDLDDPAFSLNENLAMRFGAGLADTLGVSIGSLGKSVGSAAAGVGGALKKLFGR